MTSAGSAPPFPRFDVVAVGESMLTLYRDPGTAADAFAWDICGAESNVALQRCQRLGHVVAMSAMTSELDVGPLPDESAINAMLGAGPQQWGGLVYPGAPAGQPSEAAHR